MRRQLAIAAGLANAESRSPPPTHPPTPAPPPPLPRRLQRAESRRVLVLYMPISSGLWGWFRPADLEPFEGGTGAGQGGRVGVQSRASGAAAM